MVRWAAGGPQQYSGRSMGDSHRHLNITEDEWDAFVDDLHQALDKFAVPAQEEQDLTAIVQSTHDAIVVLPPLARGERAGRGLSCAAATAS